MVFGIPESEKESVADLEAKVLVNVFRERLGVTLSTVERIHRIGKKSARPRPVILRLYDYREKSEVYKQCSKLKGSGISISDNFSKETLAKRKMLWDSAKQERDSGRHVRLNYDKLHVDSDVYTWDHSKSSRVKVQRPKRRAAAAKDD